MHADTQTNKQTLIELFQKLIPLCYQNANRFVFSFFFYFFAETQGDGVGESGHHLQMHETQKQQDDYIPQSS